MNKERMKPKEYIAQLKIDLEMERENAKDPGKLLNYASAKGRVEGAEGMYLLMSRAAKATERREERKTYKREYQKKYYQEHEDYYAEYRKRKRGKQNGLDKK